MESGESWQHGREQQQGNSGEIEGIAIELHRLLRNVRTDRLKSNACAYRAGLLHSTGWARRAGAL
jgi:hypothetical protein